MHIVKTKRITRKKTVCLAVLGAVAAFGFNSEHGLRLDLAQAQAQVGNWQKLKDTPWMRRLFQKQSAAKFRAEAPKYWDAVNRLLHERLPDLSVKERHELAALFISLCQKYKFSPAMMLGLIHVESSFRPDVESYAGAVGLMQILPSTAVPLARELGLPWRGKESLRDPKFNLRLGFHYLAYLRSRFNERKKYVTAYNWGPGRVGEMIERREQLPLGYYNKIQRSQAAFAAVDPSIGM